MCDMVLYGKAEYISGNKLKLNRHGDPKWMKECNSSYNKIVHLTNIRKKRSPIARHGFYVVYSSAFLFDPNMTNDPRSLLGKTVKVEGTTTHYEFTDKKDGSLITGWKIIASKIEAV